MRIDDELAKLINQAQKAMMRKKIQVVSTAEASKLIAAHIKRYAKK